MTTDASVRAPHSSPPLRGAPLTVIVAAWSVPVLVIGQFAWLGTLPVALVLIGTFWAGRRLRPLRWPAIALATTYAVPYIIWKTRTDPAPSLSKDINPSLAVLVVGAAVAVIIAFHLARGRTMAAT